MSISKILALTAVSIGFSFITSSVFAEDLKTNEGLKVDRNFCILEGQEIQPRLEDLKRMFFYCHQKVFSRNGRLVVRPSDHPRLIAFDVQDDPFITTQLETTGLLSYLLYRDGKVVKDATTPKSRLGEVFDDHTRFHSASVGKSLTAYLLGHAICRGNVSGLNQTLEDWPLLKNTLYEKQRLGDLVNMYVGDSKYFSSERVLFENSKGIKGVNHETIGYFGQSLQNTKPPFFRSFNYSQMVSGLVTNYVAFKMDGGFDQLLREVYTDKVGIASALEIGHVDALATSEEGRLSNSVWATRYDYLRIAITMLEDWRSDSCVGKYLKDLYRNQVRGNPDADMGHGLFRRHHRYPANYKYAGFFHTDMAGAKGTVFGMAGYGGQFIFINFENGTIVVTNSVHDNFDTAKLVIDAINE
jgi:CubicO group peptidase (beta-lactamase class C family)